MTSKWRIERALWCLSVVSCVAGKSRSSFLKYFVWYIAMQLSRIIHFILPCTRLIHHKAFVQLEWCR